MIGKGHEMISPISALAGAPNLHGTFPKAAPSPTDSNQCMPVGLPISANGVPQFRNSWHMSLFKLVSSASHKEITQQVKYAAL